MYGFLNKLKKSLKNYKSQFLSDICCGMAYLERNKILHCDLCASNVLLNNNNDAKISDFGLSRRLNEFKSNNGSNKLRIRWTAPVSIE